MRGKIEINEVAVVCTMEGGEDGLIATLGDGVGLVRMTSRNERD